jgi:hypothetical protein
MVWSCTNEAADPYENDCDRPCALRVVGGGGDEDVSAVVVVVVVGSGMRGVSSVGNGDETGFGVWVRGRYSREFVRE